MRKARPFGFLVVLSTLTGCVLPLPHIKHTCGTIDGTVIDEHSRQPIKDAEVKVSYPDGGQRKTQTDAAGRFHFPSKHRFHWGYVFGVALNYSLPNDCGWFAFSTVTIEAEGYESILFCADPDHPFCPRNECASRQVDKFLYKQPAREISSLKEDADWRFPAILIPPTKSVSAGKPVGH